LKYNALTFELTFDADNEKAIKPVKRGCKVHDNNKLLVNTTSLKKALTTLSIDENDIKRAKQTILKIKK
jgi:hypothetical protein